MGSGHWILVVPRSSGGTERSMVSCGNGQGTGKLTSAWRISALVAGDLCKQGMRIQLGGPVESISPEGGILSAEKGCFSLRLKFG